MHKSKDWSRFTVIAVGEMALASGTISATAFMSPAHGTCPTCETLSERAQ
jgi:hypothetical protein